MQEWSAFLTAIGGFLVALGGRELVVGWWKKRSGKADEEKARTKEILEDSDKLRDRLEHQYSVNRIQKEYSSRLRRMMIEKGIPVSEIPDWPREGR